VIISPDATGAALEFDGCAVVLEHPASSTAAAAVAANHTAEPPRIPENFDLILSPLTGTEDRHMDRLRSNALESSWHSKRYYWMALQVPAT